MSLFDDMMEELDELRERNAKLVAALNDVIDVYDYCAADEADRGWAPLSAEIANAREALAPAVYGETMTKEELRQLIFHDVRSDVETLADAKNSFQEGYSVGFNDCRARVLAALAAQQSTEKP